MDNKLVIQLLKSKTEEIQSLLEHFSNNPSDLSEGIELLESRIQGLSRDFEILKKKCSVKQDESLSSNIHADLIFTSPEPIIKEVEPVAIVSEKPKDIEFVNPEKPEVEEKEQAETSIPNKNAQVEPLQLIGEKRSTQKLTDIQSAIGINDRFLFIRELFENNIDEYDTAISFVNKTDSFESVLNWIKAEKGWDLEDSSVAQFIEITKRKF
ncbi:MAG: hypothetical protein ACERIH_10035 [Labilibaculum antarcticum]